MSQSIQTFFGRLPAYWRLATMRCFIYAATVGWGVFKSGTGGYDSFSDIPKLQLIYLYGDVLASMLIVWVAFIDNTIAKVQDTRDTQFFTRTPDQQPTNPMKALVPILLVFAAVALSTITGCRTQVDPAGVYATKFGPMASWMYTQDNLVDSAVKTVGAAETWELQNHAFLVTNSPATVVTLAAVRVQTKQAAITYYNERESLATALQATNSLQMALAVSNSIVTTVNAINTYAGKASASQNLK